MNFPILQEPIHAVEAEKLVIGSVLVNPSLIHEAIEGLIPSDFTSESYRRCFVLLSEMERAGRTINPELFVQYLIDVKTRGEGLVPYVSDASGAAMHGRKTLAPLIVDVREKSMLRQISRLGEDMVRRAAMRDESAEELIAELDRELLDIQATGVEQEISLEQQAYDTIAQIDEQRASDDDAVCFPTGITPLDLHIGGFGRGELTVIGGRPGMGKSVVVTQMAIKNCLRGEFVHVFSLEMKPEQMIRRMAASLMDVPAHKIRHPKRMTMAEAGLIRKGILEIGSWPLKIESRMDLTADKVVARAKSCKRKHNTAIVAVDYLQKLRFTKKLEHRHIDVSDAAVSMAKLAKDENIAVCLLSSLTNPKGKSRNAPPTLSDFRASGDIEYEAHNALLIHRTVDEKTQKYSNQTAFIIAKARSDSPGVIETWFNEDKLIFEDAHPNGIRDDEY